MVAPIVGPETVMVPNYLDFFRFRYRYKQQRPYNLVMPYYHASCLVTTRSVSTTPASTLIIHRSGVINTLWANQARINAYEKFKSKISDRSQMGESLFQINQSLGMIATRATQLVKFTNAIRKGRFGDAKDILRCPEPRKRHPVKEQSSNWLEYHLGWAPMVNDIFTAMDIIQSPIKNTFCRGRATVPGGILVNQPAQFPGSESYYEVLNRVSVQYTAEVAISNPNLYLANSLGVINPVQIAWQLIPMSFIVDWFINVEQFLGTFTDFYGLTVQKATTTTTWDATNTRRVQDPQSVVIATINGMDRVLGVTTPNLSLRPLKALSWQRGLTAISLLTTGLKSLDTKETLKYVGNRTRRTL